MKVSLFTKLEQEEGFRMGSVNCGTVVASERGLGLWLLSLG